jgi:hypothetical protein
MKVHDPEWDSSVQFPLSLSHLSRDDAATVSTVGMAAINVKKGDGYICSGTLLGTRESWWQHVLIPASRAYKPASGSEDHSPSAVSALRQVDFRFRHPVNVPTPKITL